MDNLRREVRRWIYVVFYSEKRAKKKFDQHEKRVARVSESCVRTLQRVFKRASKPSAGFRPLARIRRYFLSSFAPRGTISGADGFRYMHLSDADAKRYPLHAAALLGDIDAVQDLLSKEGQSATGSPTPITVHHGYSAAQDGDCIYSATMLPTGTTPLHLVYLGLHEQADGRGPSSLATKCCAEVGRILVERGASIHAEDELGNPPENAYRSFLDSPSPESIPKN
ncbi:MAG: hypothetical protein MJD61_14895 [Proteobacteria bacterium]|nr:hypothetical protein [Pseudomonadota bacterium]